MAALRLLRFDGVQRAAHWLNALLFGILVVTAVPLAFGGVERLVGRHVLLADVHLWAGVALPVPLLVALGGPWGERLRRDVRRCNRWTEDELRWLWSLGRRGGAVDKFNPGQKLNVAFVGGAIAVLLATGIVMRWFGPFPISWRTGATFVHQVLAWAAVVVIAGHVVMALTHPTALRSMVSGWVPASWAERHAPAWLAEELAAFPSPDGAGHGAAHGAGHGAGHGASPAPAAVTAVRSPARGVAPGRAATAGRSASTRSRSARRPPG